MKRAGGGQFNEKMYPADMIAQEAVNKRQRGEKKIEVLGLAGPRNLSCKKLIQQQKIKRMHPADMIAQVAFNKTTKRQKYI